MSDAPSDILASALSRLMALKLIFERDQLRELDGRETEGVMLLIDDVAGAVQEANGRLQEDAAAQFEAMQGALREASSGKEDAFRQGRAGGLEFAFRAMEYVWPDAAARPIDFPSYKAAGAEPPPPVADNKNAFQPV